MKSTDNLDLFRNSDDMMASVFRKAADVARVDPHFTTAEQQKRADYYEREAAKYERAS